MTIVTPAVDHAIAAQLNESIAVKQRIADEQTGEIAAIAELLIYVLRGGGKVVCFGNGGSAADSQHIAAELVSKFRRERRALAALALTVDSSIMTSIGNDYSFDLVFSRQIEALGQPGDVALAISTSGNSPNVVNGLAAARDRGMATVLLTGASGGAAQPYADHCFQVPSASTPRIQEAHIAVAHVICELVEQEFADGG